MITGVAIRNGDGKVYSLPKPNRHCHLFSSYKELLTVQHGGPLLTQDGQTQGFVTDEGEFLDRVQGADYALKNGQIVTLQWPPDLYSEDLW